MSKYKNHFSLPANFEGFINARMPQDVFVFYDDFLGASWALDADSTGHTSGTTPQRWTLTDVTDGSTETIVDAGYAYKSTMGGILRIATLGTVGSGTNLQVCGTHFVIDEDLGLPLFFECRVRTNDISNIDYFVGLSHVDTEITNTGINDGVGFNLKNGTLYCATAKDSKEYNVDSGITEAEGAAASNDGWVRLRFFFDGKNTVSFWIDANDDNEFDFITSMAVDTTLHYLPDDEAMTPTIEATTGTTASTGNFDIDYMIVAQQRYHA